MEVADALLPTEAIEWAKQVVAPAAVPHVACITWKRWLNDGWVTGSAFVSTLAVDASRIHPELELLTLGMQPGFIVTRTFAETRASLDAKPRAERKAFRWYRAALIRFERQLARLAPLDPVGMDHALDSWCADHTFSQD